MHIFEKKAIFPKDKDLSLFVSQILECYKPQGTIYNGPQGFSTLMVRMIRSFLWDLKGR